MDPEMEPNLPAGDAPDAAEPEPEHESVYSLLQRGHELMRRRHHAQAAIVLARAALAEPGKGSILEALGRALYNSGQHDRAREAFEALLEVDPSAHYAQYALGQSLKQLRRPREARTHLRMAVALSPGSNLYRAALARLAEGEPEPADEATAAEPGGGGEAGAQPDADSDHDAGRDAETEAPPGD